jgi:hypothetical protein
MSTQKWNSFSLGLVLASSFETSQMIALFFLALQATNLTNDFIVLCSLAGHRGHLQLPI